MMTETLPAYFDSLIHAWERGKSSRCVHLGHWDFQTEPVAGLSASSDFHAAQQRLDDVMMEMVMLRSSQKVLDIGCGLGGLLENIDAQFEDMDLTGLNIDPRQLDICQRLRPHSGNRFHWYEADACMLPFEDHSFDTIFCVEAMFHFSSRRAFLSELSRVLRPGGRFAVSDILLLQSSATQSVPRFLIDAVLNEGYGPWPDPWCEKGTAVSLCQDLPFGSLRVMDATQNTRPTYDFIVPAGCSEHRDPGDPSLRSLLLLKWLHHHGGLIYQYISGTRH